MREIQFQKNLLFSHLVISTPSFHYNICVLHNKTPEHLRICTFCNLNEIEDESHFLFTCHHHKNLRTKYFNEINDKYQNFNNLDTNSKILFLFNSADPFVCRTTAAYIYNSMLNRQSILV